MSSDEQIQRMLAQKAIREGVAGLQQQSAAEGGGGLGLGGMCGRIEAFLAQAANAPAPQCIESTGNGNGGRRKNGASGKQQGDEASGDDREIHLNLILGVFEERKAAMAAAAANNGSGGNTLLLGGGDDRPSMMRVGGGGGGGLLLPGKEAEEMLYAEKMRDSQAVLSMFGALADTRGGNGLNNIGGGSSGAKKKARSLGVKGQRSREDDDDDATNAEDGMRTAEVDGDDDDDECDDAKNAGDSSDDEVVFMDYDDDFSSSDDEDAADRAKALLFGKKKPLIEEM